MGVDTAWINALVERSYQWEHLGIRKHPDGNFMIGMPLDEKGSPDPPWLHTFFPNLTEQEIEDMEQYFHISLPQEFREFYSYTNGCALFGTMLNIYGWITPRFSDMSVGLGLWNIKRYHGEMRAVGAPPNHIYFGSLNAYRNTHNYLYLDLDTGLIQQTTTRDDWTSLNTWESFSDLLLGEFDRLHALHGERGQRLFELEWYHG